MNDTFTEFVKKYTELIGNDTKLIDSLKKQYEMHCAEQEAVKILTGRYGFNRLKKKQLMPHYFDCLTTGNDNNIYNITYSDFTFDMDMFSSFNLDALSNNVYVIEGICTTSTQRININNIEFYVEDEIMHTVAGYQINGLYYLESPVLVSPHQMLRIKVNLSVHVKIFLFCL